MAQDATSPGLPDIRVPAGLTFAGLAGGLALGLALGRNEALLTVLEPVGALWLKALQMTIMPLVVGLLVTGILRTAAAARAGAMARRTLGLFAALLLGGAVLSALVMPALLAAYPISPEARLALSESLSTQTATPPAGLGDFLGALVPENVFGAAAEGAMLPLIVFFTLFAAALTRLPASQRDSIGNLFQALAAAMMVMIGWVLALSPLGVFALGFSVAAASGTSAIGALAHYIALVSGVGLLIVLGGYLLAFLGARIGPLAFARALLPVQALAISTQSSLACLPAMLGASRRLQVREDNADFVLPLAVALFRATGPAMNLAVAIYVCQLGGVELTPMVLAAGVATAALTTLGSPSLPGSISFVTAIAPIALAMGAPVGALALLVAVEVLPDIIRTLGNVTMDVAVTATVDRRASGKSVQSAFS